MKNKLINKYIILLFLLILFHVTNNIYFLHLDDTPLVFEPRGRHELSIENFNKLKNADFDFIINQYLFFSYDYILSPSLLFCYSSFFFYPFFGTSEDVTAFQGTIFLVILIIATYLLGKELFNKDVGLLSAVLISFSPIVLAISKVPYDDIVLAAMFTLTLYFFVKSNKFSSIKYIWLFNVSLGLTIQSKYNSILIIFSLVFIYLFFKLLFARKDFKNYFSNLNKRNIKHFLVSFFVSITFPFIVYLSRFSGILATIEKHYGLSKISYLGFSHIFSTVKNFIFYYYLSFDHISILALFVISFVFFLFFSKKNKLLVLSIVLAANIFQIFLFFFFPISTNLILRYMAFIIPLYSMIISYFLVVCSDRLLSILSRRLGVRKIRKHKFSLSLILIFIVVIPQFTWVLNYNEFSKQCYNLTQKFSRYCPLSLDYDVNKLKDEITNHEFNVSRNILIVSDLNEFIVFFNLLNLEYPHINITYLVYQDDILILKDKNDILLSNSDILIDNNTFNLNILDSFDYIIIADNLTDSSNFDDFLINHKQIKDYLFKNPDKFSLFEVVQSKDLKTDILIYKNNKNLYL